MPTDTFDSPGSYTYSVPTDTDTITVRLYGGAGGAGLATDNYSGTGETLNTAASGGDAGFVEAEFAVADLPSEIDVYVAGDGGDGTSSAAGTGGFNGGAGGGFSQDTSDDYTASGGGGGGSSDIRPSGGSASDRYAVAAGGGGGGAASTFVFQSDTAVDAGAGGAADSAGEDASTGDITASGGSAGGTGGSSIGGTAGSADDAGEDEPTAVGGGGGGGWQGGAGASGVTEFVTDGGDAVGAGGGGGSNYLDGTESTIVADTTSATSGLVEIEYTEKPATPDNATQTVTGRDSTTVDWDADTSGGPIDSYELERSVDGGAYELIATIPGGTTTYDDSLPTGVNTVEYRVRAVNDGGESGWATTAQKSTEIASVSVSNVTADAADLSWDSVDDAEGYDVLLAEASGSTRDDYSVATSVSAGTLSTTLSGLENGEQYYARVDASYPDGDSLSTDEADWITTLPAPTITLDASIPREIIIDVDLGDNSSDGDVVVDRTDGTGGSFERVATITDLSAPAYTDAGLPNEATRTYRVERRTDHASAQSGEATATTIDVAPRDRTRPAGWHVAVDVPGGTTIEPAVLDDPQLSPGVNGLPELRVPVAGDRDWEALIEQPMRAYKDGYRLPIEELVAVEQRPDGVALVGGGGVELQRDIDAEANNDAAHEFVALLIPDETSYQADVDDPAQDLIEDELLQSADSTSELTNRLVAPIPADDPREITNGVVENADTAHPYDCITDRDDGAGFGFDESDAYNNAQALFVGGSGQYTEYQITPQHDIPAERVGIQIRDKIPDDGSSTSVQFLWDGTEFDKAVGQSFSLGWTDIGSGFYGGDGYETAVGADLQAGTTYTLRIEHTGENSGGYIGDVVAVYDTAYDHSFPNPTASENGGGFLDGPEPKPKAVDVEFEDATTPFAVEGGRAELTIDDTSGSQVVAVSNDQGQSFETASNTDVIDTQFADDGGTIRLRVTLSRYGSRDDFPATGFKSQSLDAYDLFADLSDTPVLVAQRYTGDVVDVLNEIARFSDSIWTVEWDPAAEAIAVVWTKPGQRDPVPDIQTGEAIDYSVTESTRDKTLAATVRGGRVSWTGERFTANHGTAVDLEHSNLIQGVAHVYEPSDGTAFVRGEDYELATGPGEITTLSSGAMTDGTTYAIDYDYKPEGRYEDPDWSGSARTETTVTIAGLTTPRECQQAALRLVESANEGRTDVEAVLRDVPPDQSLARAIDLDALPVDEPLDVAAPPEVSPREVTFALEDRAPLSRAIEDLRERVQEVSDRV